MNTSRQCNRHEDHLQLIFGNDDDLHLNRKQETHTKNQQQHTITTQNQTKKINDEAHKIESANNSKKLCIETRQLLRNESRELII